MTNQETYLRQRRDAEDRWAAIATSAQARAVHAAMRDEYARRLATLGRTATST